ncbi:MAG TPA: hypothetical protein VMG37_24370 [Solirubrobacteraceae bacterium]|nr:hypothetical protein [Solirubrobacteraceae bacterium]
MDGKAGRQAGWVAPIALAILVGCLLMASPARAGTIVNVPATAGPLDDAGTTGFVDTGVSVQGSASVSASGVIDIGYGATDTPDGDPGAGACSTQCPVPTLTYWSLIARIGNGPWQEVGSGPTTIFGTGEVFLGVDDDGYTDNSGQWTATVNADPAQSDDPRLAVALDIQNGTVTSTSGSINCGPSGTACFATSAPGTAVTLNAVANSGYTFAGWVGGGCTGSGACQVTSGSSNVVEATFAPSSVTAPVLTLTNTDDHSGVEPRGSGATYTLTAGVSANSPAGENGPRLFTIYDPLPAGETLSAAPAGSGWNCAGSGGSEVRCTTSSQATIAAGATLPSITVPVTVAASAPSPVVNAAEVISSDAESAVIATDVMTAPQPPPSAPAVAAAAPAVKGSSGATFAGTVNPEGLTTSAHFEYGLDPRYSGGGSVVYDQTTPTVTVGADSTSHSLSQVVTGLVPHAAYHVRLVATNSAGTATSTDEVFTTGKAPAPPPPTLGRTENVEPISGLVFVKLPRAQATAPTRSPGGVVTGEGFIPLTQARQLPVGSEIDARRGTLQILVATPERRRTQQARLSGGVFSIGQIRTGSHKGLTTFTLKENAFPGGPTYASCGVGKKTHTAGGSTPVARAAKLSRKILQVLHASDNHGNFRTTGRYSAATVLGTQWTVADRCDGTLTTVKRGRVNVLDFHTGKTITLRAGQSFLANRGG